uniref:Cystatin E/M n=1 Tax=Microcebus murinus TaxID=30608 RepID=A0A8C5V9F6_MICMU|nr:cystatin-M [Microcebus murinus]
MARPNLPLSTGLALLALCLLMLSCDARSRRQGHMLGERQNLSTSDPQVQKVVQAAVASYNMGSNSLYYFRNTHIIKAERQLVAGIKYYLTVDMESTTCHKNRSAGDHVDLTTCPFAVGKQQEKLRCDFEILIVPWQNSTQLLKHNCVQI